MSASPIVTNLPPYVLKRKIIRYAFGITLMSAIAFGINWPVSFLSIVLINSFLMLPKLPVKAGLSFLMKVFVAVFFSWIISYYIMQYQLIYTILIGLIFLHIFYAKDSIISPLLKTWLTIAVLIVPLMSLQTAQIGELVGWAIIVATGSAIIVAWIAFAIFPDIEYKGSNDQHKLPDTIIPPEPFERFIIALKRTAVVYPVVLLFSFYEFQSDALILIYVGLYSSFPGFAKDLSVGKMLLVGCFTGGIISFFLYELMVLVPVYGFLLLVFFGLALIIGNEILGGGKYAAQIKAGFSTIIIVFGSAVGSDDVDAGGKVVMRIIQISVVVIYLILAFGLLEKLFPEKRLMQENNSNAKH